MRKFLDGKYSGSIRLVARVEASSIFALSSTLNLCHYLQSELHRGCHDGIPGQRL